MATDLVTRALQQQIPIASHDDDTLAKIGLMADLGVSISEFPVTLAAAKDWLHLSLAYAFPPDQHAALAELARALVDISAPVSWELRFYERHADGAWTCHARWQQ